MANSASEARPGNAEPAWLLAGYRALDMTDEKAMLCGRVLGDLGMDVLKIEQPGGDPARRIGPFHRGEHDPDRSLSWFFENANKRGITLDITKPAGAALLRGLARSADVLIESFEPGHMAALGLGYDDLRVENPRLVFVSVTHFGQTGPHRDWRGSDLVDIAMGGLAYVIGYPDRPPVRLSVPHAYPHAGIQAAAGALTALFHAQRSHVGQHVDVSIQESVVSILNNVIQSAEITGTILRRGGLNRRAAQSAPTAASAPNPVTAVIRLPTVWPCKDGFITYFVGGGAPIPSNAEQLVDWMSAEGMPPSTSAWDIEALGPETDTETLVAELKAFFQTHTKKELWEESLRRRIPMFPLNSPRDLLEMEQLHARGFFREVDHSKLRASLIYPGGFAVVSGQRLPIRRRAPLVGEHNEEVYLGELQMSCAELDALRQVGVI